MSSGVVSLQDRTTGQVRTAFVANMEALESTGQMGTFFEPAEQEIPIIREGASIARRLRIVGRDGSARFYDNGEPVPLTMQPDGSISRAYAAQIREKIVASEPRTLRPWISVNDATAIAGFRNEMELRQLFNQRRLAEVRRVNADGTKSSGVMLGSLARVLRADPPEWSTSAIGSPVQTMRDEQARAASGTMPVLRGHAAVFNEWTRISSEWEGDFYERVAPGAFKETLEDPNERQAVRCLFQHGFDSLIDQKPLGPVQILREDSQGLYYEVQLLDTSYNRDLIPGLRERIYGASFRFKVVLEDLDPLPGRSAHNPAGLPEATVRQVVLKEFGPVTFPAYKAATAELAMAGAA